MAAQVGALRVAIGADIRGLQTGMARAQREVSKGATAMQRSVKSVNTSLAGLGTIAGVSLGAAGLLGGAQAFLRVADAAKSLQAQLKLATSEYGSLQQANKDVRNISEQTRSDLLATAELYAALQRNSGLLGTTQAEVARATQTVAQAFKISGAATSEQSAATRQLIQAFQSGVLRGDEFNSIMENAPRLAKLLADSLGVTTGQLRRMAEEGELTADKLVRAFTDKKFTEGLDNEFKQLPVTFDEAMGQVYNSAIVVFSAFDRGGQFSTSIANFVSDGTDGFAQLEERAFSFGVQVSDTITAIEQVRLALGGLKTDGVGSFFGLIDATYSWRDALADTLGILDGVANAFANLANAPGNLLRSVSGYDPIVNPVDMRGGFLRTTNKKDLAAGYQRINGKSIADILSDAGMEPKRPPAYRPPPAKSKKAKGAGRTAKPPRDRSEDVSFQFEQELRQAQMDVMRAQQSLAVTSEDRAQIALQLLTADRASQEAELNERVRRAERDFAEKKITAGALEQVKVQAEQLRLEYDKTNALEVQKVNEELAAERSRDRADLADSSRDIQIELLQLESSLKTTAAERRAVELRILDAMKAQEKARLEAVIADKQSSELAKLQAQQRLDALDSIYAGRAAGVVAGTRGPIEDYLASLPSTAERAQEALEQLQVQGIEGLIDASLKLSEGLDSAKDALLQTLKDFLLGLARMEMQKGVASLFGSSGGISGIFGSLFGGGSSSGIPTIALDAFGTGNNIPRFARGGGFNVLGNTGVDNNLLSLNGLPIAKVSYGERISVSNDNTTGRQGMGSRGDVNVNVYGVTDANSFHRSETQIARAARRRLGV